MFEVSVVAVEVAAQVHDATSSLAAAARTCASWTPAERSAVLAEVRAAQAALAQVQGFVLVADRDAGDTQRPGDRSFEAAQARVLRCGFGEATRQVRQADALVSMELVASGVRDGSVPLGHLDSIARAAATATPEVASLLRSPAAQELMVSAAHQQSQPDFARFLARYVASLDPATLDEKHESQRRERFLSMSTRPEGVFLKGRLDRVGGESLRVALDAMGQFGDETRSSEQAAADALVMLAEKVCAGTAPQRGGIAGPRAGGVRSGSPAGGAGADAGGAGVGSDAWDGGDVGCVSDQALERVVDGGAGAMLSGTVSRAHLSLIVPAETIAELLAHQRALDEAHGVREVDRGGPGAATERDVVCAPIDLPWGTVAPATLEDGTPVSMTELARAMCDSEITRVVMSAEGLPLDVGRTKRLFTSAQRRAVVVRDQQCIWNGCEQPASRCEVHHLRWWGRDKGVTSVTNSGLVCKHHHSEVHRLDLVIQRLEKPPGWVSRQRAKVEPVATYRDDPAGTIAAREPMRYVFRNRRGDIVNAPPDDDSAARG